MLLLEVKAVLVADDRSKGVLKMGRVTGNPTVGLTEMLGRVLVNIVDVSELQDDPVGKMTGVLIAVVDVTGTVIDTVVTGRPDTFGGGLVTTGKAAVICG